MKSQKNRQCTAQIPKYFVIYIMASLKMHLIIKQASARRQIFEAVNLAFIIFKKIFSQNCHLRHFSFFREIFVMHFDPTRTFDMGEIRDTNLPKKSRNAQEIAILTKKSNIFIKAKLTASKNCLLDLACFMI